MNFRDAPAVEEAVYQMRLIELGRSRNRYEINKVFNGWPPFDEQEQVQNQATGDTNVNFLSGTHINMSARGQYQNALIAPNPLVDVTVDYGKPYQRQEISLTVDKEMNRIVKGSLAWNEEERSTFAQLTLHGIGPSAWDNRYRVIPAARGIEDVLIPSETLRDMTNCPFISIFRRYTAGEMMEVLRGPHCDPAWNKPLVRKLIRWVSEQAIGLLGNRWPDWLKPESLGELAKENSGLFWSDNIPTIDCYDFYYYDDTGRKSGWKRRMILDVWGQPGAGGYSGKAPRAEDKFDRSKFAGDNTIEEEDTRAFLYNSGDRIYASDLSEIIHFQYGDVSAVAPFRYHTTRGLGFLMYALCHLENRFKCRIMDHAFESLLQFFRVTNPGDEQKALAIDLYNRAVIPDGVTMVPQGERWQVQDSFLENVQMMLGGHMQANSASYMQAPQFGNEKPNETATATMARVNSVSQLVGFVLSSAYDYQRFKYHEMLRRLLMPDSRDILAKKFRLRCLKAGVPEKALDIDRMEVEAMKVTGGGNRMLQIAIAEKLLAARPLHGPQAQSEILRMYDASISNDPDLANRLNPTVPKVTDSARAGQLDAGVLMQNLPVAPVDGLNESEYVSSLLGSLGAKIKSLTANGNTATGPEIAGLGAVAQVAGQHLQILAGDKESNEIVKKLGDALGKLSNFIKGFAQRFQEKQKANGQQLDPETQAKIQAILMQAKAKAKVTQDSAASRTAQKQIAFEAKLKQDAQKHQMELAQSVSQNRANFFEE